MSGMYAFGGLLHSYCMKFLKISDNARSELCVTRFSFDRTKHEFVTSDCPVISHIIALENIAICACQSAVEHATGITKVYFLLGDISKVHSSGTCIFYLCVMAVNRVVVVGKITLVAEPEVEAAALPLASISILDGPNVCLLTHSGSLYYTWPMATGQTVELHSANIPSNCHLTSFLWCGCDDLVTNIVAIGTCVQQPDAMETCMQHPDAMETCTQHSDAMETCSDSDHSLVAVTMAWDKQGHCTNATLDSTDIVPSMYSNITLCIYIKQLTVKSPDQNVWHSGTNAGDAQTPQRSDAAHHTSLPVSVSAVACTSYSQVLLFEEGLMLKCGTLPFDNADKIMMFETATDSAYIAVHSANNVVCLILAATFEVLHICTHDQSQTVNKYGKSITTILVVMKNW